MTAFFDQSLQKNQSQKGDGEAVEEGEVGVDVPEEAGDDAAGDEGEAGGGLKSAQSGGTIFRFG